MNPDIEASRLANVDLEDDFRYMILQPSILGHNVGT